MWNSKGPNSQPCNINWLPPRAAWTFPLQWKMNLSETKAQTTHAMRQCHYSHPYRLFSEIIKNHISMILISTFPDPGLWYKKVYLELPPPPGILVSWIWEEKKSLWAEDFTSWCGRSDLAFKLVGLSHPTLPHTSLSRGKRGAGPLAASGCFWWVLPPILRNYWYWALMIWIKHLPAYSSPKTDME